MKVVNATWELRNLGKRTLELTLEKTDFERNPKEIYTDIEAVEKEYQSEYTVVKVKTGRPQVGWELQKNGFWHIETQINLKATREDIACVCKQYEGLFPDISLQKVEQEEEVYHIQEEIRKGIFTTDRIALDPYFGEEIANRRYANWVGDEVKRNRILCYAVCNGVKIGFSLSTLEGWGLLGGIFSEYQKENVGGAFELAGVNAALNTDIEVFYTSVSSNNIKILKLHEMFGYRVRSLVEVYIRHDSLR